MRLRCLRRLLLLALLLAPAAGCDDPILFDIDAAGRILVAVDSAGRTAVIGDGARPRHVCRVDPVSGAVERLTERPRQVSWLRALGDGALFVEERRRLVLLEGGAARTLFESERRLQGPVPSPDGRRVAVLEAERLGVPGTLHVLELRAGAPAERVASIPDALLGASWTDAGLLVARSTGPRSGAFELGPGELVEVRGAQRRRWAALPLPGVVLMGTAGGLAVASVPLTPGAERVGLAVFRGDPPGVRKAPDPGVCDLWPQLEPGGGQRILFTRARPERPTLEGELRLTRVDALDGSRQIPTPGPVSAPRWLGADRVVFVTRDDHLVVQDLSGEHRTDFSAMLQRAAAGANPGAKR